MAEECSPVDIDKVKAILKELKKFIDTPQEKNALKTKIKVCAKKIPLEGNYSEDDLRNILKEINGISDGDITEIVAAVKGLPAPSESGTGAAPGAGSGGGKRKSKKSKSKKRRSKRRKHRKMRRTRR